MTDEQIIKAADIFRTGKCNGCPYHGLYTAGCVTELIKDVFGFINRQKEEIDRLNIELQSMRSAANSYKMHYEKAQTEIEKLTLEIEEANESDREVTDKY